MARFKKPATDFDLPALEEEVLARWRATDAPAKVLARKEGRPPFVFYEGPPTANGRPGIHHVLARTLKDVVCRYQTMTGHHVPRKAGWDTHGLPVEIEVQKELGISIKPEIEKYGIGLFNERCRASVFKYKDEWERLSERIGYWLDYAHPYVTCDNAYISSAWSILTRFFEEGLLERGQRILPWCSRCGTGLSSHEVAQGYQDVQDPSVFVRFPRRGHAGESFLVWTTTPWTLPSNVAIAIHPDLTYVRARRETKEGTSEVLVLAEALAAKVLAIEKGGPKFEVIEKLPGRALVGEGYERPFDWLPFEGGKHEVIVAATFVSSEEGSGIVHLAPAFGEDDHAVAKSEGLALLNPVDAQGRFVASVPIGAGQFVRDANSELARDLDRRGKLFRRDSLVHSYPHCWRCKTPLIYWLRPSWYLRTTRIKDKLVELNRQIEWFPPEMGTGRFGEWLDHNVDWAISRERYWGTPLNVWVCEKCNALRSVRSEAELRQLASNLPKEFDLHRPHIDAIALPCARAGCGGSAKRTPEVVDCWFDSGAMPFAQQGWIAEKGKAPPAEHPADYIAEGLDQTRGWFYTLHVISTFLTGKPASRRVLVGNLVLDAKKQKMSKSRGNTVDPWEEIAAHGSDAVRWHLLSQSHPWLPKSYDSSAVGATSREFFGTLFNCWSFFSTYAEIDDFDPARQRAPDPSARTELDRWLLAEVERLVEEVGAAYDRYDLTRAATLLATFVDRKLSNWYVRLSRPRFWGRETGGDKLAAFHTLFEAMRSVALLLAPIAPFFADALWHWLEPGAASIHLEDFPRPRHARRNAELEADMEVVLDVVALGRRARNVASIPVRQPLRRLFVKGADARADTVLGGHFVALVADELNVHEVVVAGAELATLRTLKAKPNFRQLGPRLGPKLNAAKQALGALTPAQIEELLRASSLTLDVAGEPIPFTTAEIEVIVEGKPGFGVETDGRTLVALDTTLTPELRDEGDLREIVKRVNNSRRDYPGLRVEDRIELHLGGAERLTASGRRFAEEVKRDTLAVKFLAEGAVPTGEGWRRFEWDVDGEPLIVSLRRAIG